MRVHRKGEIQYISPNEGRALLALCQKVAFAKNALDNFSKAVAKMSEKNSNDSIEKGSRQYWAQHLYALQLYCKGEDIDFLTPSGFPPWDEVGLGKDHWKSLLPVIEAFVQGYGVIYRNAYRGNLDFTHRNDLYVLGKRVYDGFGTVPSEYSLGELFEYNDLVDKRGYKYNLVLPNGTIIWKETLSLVCDRLTPVRKCVDLDPDSEYAKKHTFIKWCVLSTKFKVVKYKYTPVRIYSRGWWAENLYAFRDWMCGAFVKVDDGYYDTWRGNTRKEMAGKQELIEAFAAGKKIAYLGDSCEGTFNFASPVDEYKVVSEELTMVNNDQVRITDKEVIFKMPSFAFKRKDWNDFALQAFKDVQQGKKKLVATMPWSIGSWFPEPERSLYISMVELWATGSTELFINGRKVEDYELLAFDSITVSYSFERQRGNLSAGVTSDNGCYAVKQPTLELKGNYIGESVLSCPPERDPQGFFYERSNVFKDVNGEYFTREWWQNFGIPELKRSMRLAEGRTDSGKFKWCDCPVSTVYDRIGTIIKWANGLISLGENYRHIETRVKFNFTVNKCYKPLVWFTGYALYSRNDWKKALPAINAFIEKGGGDELFSFGPDCQRKGNHTRDNLRRLLPVIIAFIDGAEVEVEVEFGERRHEGLLFDSGFGYKAYVKEEKKVFKPWTKETGPEEVWVRRKGREFQAFLMKKDSLFGCEQYLLNGFGYTVKDLFDNFEHLDGSPCGQYTLELVERVIEPLPE